MKMLSTYALAVYTNICRRREDESTPEVEKYNSGGRGETRLRHCTRRDRRYHRGSLPLPLCKTIRWELLVFTSIYVFLLPTCFLNPIIIVVEFNNFNWGYQKLEIKSIIGSKYHYILFVCFLPLRTGTELHLLTPAQTVCKLGKNAF